MTIENTNQVIEETTTEENVNLALAKFMDTIIADGEVLLESNSNPFEVSRPGDLYKILQQIQKNPEQLEERTVNEFKSFVSDLENNHFLNCAPNKDGNGHNLLGQMYVVMATIAKYRQDQVGPDWIEGIIAAAVSGTDKDGKYENGNLTMAKYCAVHQYALRRCGQISHAGFDKLMDAAIHGSPGATKAVNTLIERGNWESPIFDAESIDGVNRYSCIKMVTEEHAKSISDRTKYNASGALFFAKTEIYYQRDDLREVIGDFYDWTVGRNASVQVRQQTCKRPMLDLFELEYNRSLSCI